MINRAKRLIARFAVSGRSYVALEQRCQALAAKVIRFHRANQVLKRRLAALREGQEKLREGQEKKALINPRWAHGDPTNETRDWPAISVEGAPYVLGRRSRIRVLLLNSMGGSMGRLSKALMMHEGIDADVMIGAYSPRRNLVHPHETNVFGIYTHDEWRNYLKWAVGEYDIVQSSTLPPKPAVAECYDWLTETIGRRHIWRETGFVHHYLVREDVLPLAHYQADLQSQRVPDAGRFTAKSFRFSERYILTDPHVVFYSSPEKGAYFKGADTIWLPSIRDPEIYSPAEVPRRPTERIRIYVPAHGAAMWKGMSFILRELESMQRDGAPIDIVTADSAARLFPDLKYDDQEEARQMNYPIPSHKLPELLRRMDLVVDQIVMGSYGNTGIEAMLCGKPVIGQKRYKELADAPVWDVDEGNFRERVTALLDRRDEWDELGAASRAYAQRVHSPEAVARVAAETYRRLMDEARF